MALIKCPECGKEISDKAEACIFCGYTVRTMSEKSTAVLGDKLEKKSAKKYMDKKVLVPILALFAIIVLVGILFTMNSGNLSATQVVMSVEAGVKIESNTLIEAEDAEAVVDVNISEVVIEEVGEYPITYTVTVNKRSKTYSSTLAVVDTTPPTINGDDSLLLLRGDEIKWEDYYTISDIEEISAKDIESDKEIDTSKKGKYEIVLSVKDSSGNVGEKEIQVEVISPTAAEETCVAAIEYLMDKNVILRKEKIERVACFDEFVIIDDNYVFADTKNDLCMSLREAALLGTTNSYSTVKMMVDALVEEQNLERIMVMIDE